MDIVRSLHRAPLRPSCFLETIPMLSVSSPGVHTYCNCHAVRPVPLCLPASAAVRVRSHFLLKAEHCSATWAIHVLSQLAHPWMLSSFTCGYRGICHCLLAPVVGIAVYADTHSWAGSLVMARSRCSELTPGSGATHALGRLSLSPRTEPWQVDSVEKVLGMAVSIALAAPRPKVVSGADRPFRPDGGHTASTL